MERVLTCHICLASDVKLYEISKCRLETAYENLSGLKMCGASGAKFVCSYCGTLLMKFNKFRSICINAQQVLDRLLKQHTLITSQHIKSLSPLYTPCTKHIIQNSDTTITVKDENDELLDNNCPRINTAQVANVKIEDILNDHNIFDDGENKIYDSDSEPIAKKVKKKKPKRKLKKTLVTQAKCSDDLTITDLNTDVITDIPVDQTNAGSSDVEAPPDDVAFDKDFEDNNTEAKQTTDLAENHELTILSQEEQIQEVLARKQSVNYQNSRYKCESCYKGFMTQATYNNHMARHDPSCGPVSCAVCATRWPDARGLRAHTLIAHERRYTCKSCGHRSKSAHAAREHGRWHAGARYSCACGRSFQRTTTYLTHARLAHARHACQLCARTFLGQNGLNMHMKKAHWQHNGEVSAGSQCERCGVTFSQPAALLRHAQLTHARCEQTMHVCTQCGEHLASERHLAEHRAQHDAPALFTCTQCSKTFARERSLAAHATRAHAGPAPRRVCHVCGHTSLSASSLAAHLRVHSGEKPHACALCHKKFSLPQNLQIHVRTHTGERPFQCARCPKAFKHKAALNRHDRVHTGVKPYACPQCGKRFSQSNSMKQHCAGVHMKEYIYPRHKAHAAAAVSVHDGQTQ